MKNQPFHDAVKKTVRSSDDYSLLRWDFHKGFCSRALVLENDLIDWILKKRDEDKRETKMFETFRKDDSCKK